MSDMTKKLLFADPALLRTLITELQKRDGHLKNMFRSSKHYAVIRCALNAMKEAARTGYSSAFTVLIHVKDLADPIHGKEPELARLMCDCFDVQYPQLPGLSNAWRGR